MWKKIHWNLLVMTLLSSILLGFTHKSIASTVEKLAHYEAMEFLQPAVSSLSTSFTLFKNQPYVVHLIKSNDNALTLVTTTFKNNYSSLKSFDFNVDSLLPHANADYDITLAANNDEMYLFVTSSNDDYKSQKNLLFKSTDGSSWSLFKTFPSEWLLYDLEVNNDNLILSCVNCQDEAQLSYLISSNRGLKWHKYSLPESANTIDFSAVTSSRVFAGTTTGDPEHHGSYIYTLYSNDITASTVSPHNKWVKANIKQLLSFKTNHNGETLTFKFKELSNLFEAEDLLFAQAEYRATSLHHASVNKYFIWVSKDNGLTWELLDFDLKDEVVTQLSKHNAYYHLVTSKNNSFTYSPDPDSTSTDSELENFKKAFQDYLHEQKYSYYKISEQTLKEGSTSCLKPNFEFTSAVGLNLNYQANPITSYVDVLLLNSFAQELGVEFYRLHD